MNLDEILNLTKNELLRMSWFVEIKQEDNQQTIGWIIPNLFTEDEN